ncbi:MAG TPA: DNA-directed RNA polymerase subunit alpha C-terminal domain-containing protein [Pirellulaceae bacterium]|nr:DNA-directed RNA polymerase subunit alpha C-terminal domain-containing protein [Pirellulaceae bacterium]HMO91869.1 DNA-directed RNA polymerase subunit alpha C-terminal domain-containing protein [Pirellulaceae bacterium]HMP69721.1 DNA-directed RNA polymerase subunit alpha C-terminal domain-containing protein [Pirellulaceae bacterium]
MAKTRVRLSQNDENQRHLRERLDLSTAEIGLTVRTTNCLEERGIFTVEDLLNTNRADLLSIQNFGEKTLEEVYKALEAIGFYRPGREAAVTEDYAPNSLVLNNSIDRRNRFDDPLDEEVAADYRGQTGDHSTLSARVRM